MPGGGWVSTHEDVTDQRKAEEERAAILDQEKRRAIVDRAIAMFRPEVEKLLLSVSDSASAMRTTAAALFASSGQTTRRAEIAVAAFNEASRNVEIAAAAAEELSGSIAEISRQLNPLPKSLVLRPKRRTRPTARSRHLHPAHRRSAMLSSSFARLPNRPICWRSTPQSKRHGPGTPARALPWLPRRSNRLRCRPPRRRRISQTTSERFRIRFQAPWPQFVRSRRASWRSINIPGPWRVPSSNRAPPPTKSPTMLRAQRAIRVKWSQC